MAKVSVLIPARNEQWLAKTVDELFEKAKGEIEVIVTLDGYWPDPILKDRPNLILIHRSESQGLRAAINSMVSVATGEYVMKIDAHCMFAEGFDEALKADFEPNWISVPCRYSMDAEKWERGYGPMSYLFLTFPYETDKQFGEGLHGKKWIGESGNSDKRNPSNYYWKENLLKDKKIDDIQAFQGSCWFMNRKRFLELGGLDDQFGSFYQEAQEISFKTWFSGGRIIVNKNTWYAHWHKNTPPGYGFSRHKKLLSSKYSTWYWMNDQWPAATRKMEEFIAFHWPIPSWPEDWRQKKEIFEKEHPQDFSTPPDLRGA